MIGVYLNGRLGNQMFQYAFALNVSKKLDTAFLLDDKYCGFILPDYFYLRSYSYFLSRIQTLKFRFTKKKNVIVEVNNANSFSSNESLLKSDNCLYKGFFQSEQYFREFADLVKQEFTIKKKHRINVKAFLGIDQNKPLVVLHVRRTDYLQHGDESMGDSDLSLPLTYYNLCLQKIKNPESYSIVFVTDDPAYVKSHFSNLNPIVSSNKNPIIDFQILLEADILVLANSSFSWWGAYLNTVCKKIYAPKYWLGFRIKKDYPDNIIPDNWESVEF